MALPGPWNSLKGFPAETSKWRCPLKRKDLYDYATKSVCSNSCDPPVRVVCDLIRPGCAWGTRPGGDCASEPTTAAGSRVPHAGTTADNRASCPGATAGRRTRYGQAGLEGGDGREAEIRE